MIDWFAKVPPLKLILEEGEDLSPLEVLLKVLLLIILLNLVLELNIACANVVFEIEPYKRD